MTLTDLFASGVVGAGVAALTWASAWYFARRQNALLATTVAADWLRDVREWAGQGISTITQAAYTCRKDSGEKAEAEYDVLADCRHQLSALIDRGRLLLPNERDNEYGQHKPPAYRGYRHPALDALVAAERLLGRDPELFEFPDCSTALEGVRKEFVSTMQAILNPRATNRTIAAILLTVRSEREADPTVGGLLPHPEKVPPGATRLLYIASLRYSRQLERDQTRPSPRAGSAHVLPPSARRLPNER